MNGHWNLTLFPSLPLALIAVARLNSSPLLILVEEDSVFSQHVSTACLRQQGCYIRTYEEQDVSDKSGHSLPKPNHQMRVHQTIATMNERLARTASLYTPSTVWDHIENVTEQDLSDFPLEVGSSNISATLRLPGCPGAVALVLRKQHDTQLEAVVETLGLHYQSRDQV
jgi:hypothetical protein